MGDITYKKKSAPSRPPAPFHCAYKREKYAEHHAKKEEIPLLEFNAQLD